MKTCGHKKLGYIPWYPWHVSDPFYYYSVCILLYILHNNCSKWQLQKKRETEGHVAWSVKILPPRNTFGIVECRIWKQSCRHVMSSRVLTIKSCTHLACKLLITRYYPCTRVCFIFRPGCKKWLSACWTSIYLSQALIQPRISSETYSIISLKWTQIETDKSL